MKLTEKELALLPDDYLMRNMHGEFLAAFALARAWEKAMLIRDQEYFRAEARRHMQLSKVLD